MIRLAGTRILGALVQILVVTLLAWLLFYVIARFTGASPAQRIAGKTASPAQIALVAKSLGLNQPYWRQYLTFLGRLLRGNFGYSYVQNRPVSQILWPAIRATASLVLGAAVVWLAIAIPIGSYGGLRPRSFGDVAGRADVLTRGEDVALFASGMMLAPALAAARLLGAHGVAVSLVNVPVIKPLDAATVREVATAASPGSH